MGALKGLLLAALAASSLRAQQGAPQAGRQTPTPEAVQQCERRFAALAREPAFRDKIFPAWMRVRFRRRADQAESVWDHGCEDGVGDRDGRVVMEAWLEQDARSAYITDRERFARGVLDRLGAAPGAVGDLSGPQLDGLPPADLAEFMGLVPTTRSDGDFRDDSLAADVQSVQDRVRSLASAGDANLQAALQAQQGRPNLDDQRDALAATGHGLNAGDGAAFDQARLRSGAGDPAAALGGSGDPAGAGGPSRQVGAAAAPPPPPLPSNHDNPTPSPYGCSKPPDVLNEPVNVTPTTMTLTGPVLQSSYSFRGTTMAANVYTANYGDGTSLQIVEATGAAAGYHNYTAQQAAESARYLPTSSRANMHRIEIDPVVNPDDAYWATTYNRPNFHSYMTSSADGVMNIYPETTGNSLNGDNVMRGSMIHETGHTLSFSRWGSDTTSAQWAPWRQAMTADGASVSNYANSSPSEDFAETYRAYHSTRGTPRFNQFRAYVPNRFRILDGM